MLETSKGSTPRLLPRLFTHSTGEIIQTPPEVAETAAEQAQNQIKDHDFSPLKFKRSHELARLIRRIVSDFRRDMSEISVAESAARLKKPDR